MGDRASLNVVKTVSDVFTVLKKVTAPNDQMTSFVKCFPYVKDCPRYESVLAVVAPSISLKVNQIIFSQFCIKRFLIRFYVLGLML